MEIDPQIAATIVANIKDVLRHEINLFNTHGVIIASTDTARIGQEHEAAALAAQSKRTVYVDAQHPYRGAKNGINTPVLIDGQVVAVIGVTGEREAVESFGNVIRKMTEILLRENIEQTARYTRRISETNLINQLIGEHADLELVRYLCAALDWDPHEPHCVVIGRLHAHGSADANVQMIPQPPLQQLDHAIYTADADECCIVLSGACDTDAVLRGLLEQFDGAGVHVGFGVSEQTSDIMRLPHCHRHARLAVDWQSFMGTERIVYAERLDFGLLLPSMQPDRMVQYVRHVFAGLPAQRIREHERTFRAYTQFNGSVTHAAQSLFIHKNTMQIHLNAIARDTGYNPRNLHDFSVLDMAFRLHGYLAFRDDDDRGE